MLHLSLQLLSSSQNQSMQEAIPQPEVLLHSPSCDSTCVVGITVAVGVVVGFVTVAGVTIGRILALGVDLFPAIAAAVTLLGVETTGVGLILAVGGSDVLALNGKKNTRIMSQNSGRKSLIKHTHTIIYNIYSIKVKAHTFYSEFSRYYLNTVQILLFF